jgi:hypothetical protein
MDAMNAAVLVSNVVNKKKTWEDAVKELETTERKMDSIKDTGLLHQCQ